MSEPALKVIVEELRSSLSLVKSRSHDAPILANLSAEERGRAWLCSSSSAAIALTQINLI
jgi:hypothetical protein